MAEPPSWTAGSFDIDVLRALYRTGVVTVAGIDPRLNVSRIASQLHASRARVATRLALWQRVGFVRGYDVWPNPALFGLSGTTLEVELKDPLAKAEFLERFAFLDGAVGALEFLGPWTAVQFVTADEAQRARRVQQVRHLEGVASLGNTLSWQPLEPRRPLSPLDVRIVRALRAAPRASLARIASSVGVSTRTVTHRYGALVDDWSVWFVPIFDFTRLPGMVVSLAVQLENEGARPAVAAQLRRAYPRSLEFGWAGFGPFTRDLLHVFFVHVDAAARLEDLQRTVRAVPGVADLEATVLVRVHSFGDWVNELLARATGAVPSPRTVAAASSRPLHAAAKA